MTEQQQPPGSSAKVPAPTASGRTPDPCVDCGAQIAPASMERFLHTFERSARRWEFVVYPALFAFIVLAGYGFFLVYSLTGDMNKMARAIDPDMADHMATMSASVAVLSEQVQVMTGEVQTMTSKVTYMSDQMDNMDYLRAMHDRMLAMDSSMRSLSATTDMIRHDMTRMSQNVSRPMSIMNTMLPW
jgi:hypothetical protein